MKYSQFYFLLGLSLNLLFNFSIWAMEGQEGEDRHSINYPIPPSPNTSSRSIPGRQDQVNANALILTPPSPISLTNNNNNNSLTEGGSVTPQGKLAPYKIDVSEQEWDQHKRLMEALAQKSSN